MTNSRLHFPPIETGGSKSLPSSKPNWEPHLGDDFRICDCKTYIEEVRKELMSREFAEILTSLEIILHLHISSWVAMPNHTREKRFLTRLLFTLSKLTWYENVLSLVTEVSLLLLPFYMRQRLMSMPHNSHQNQPF